MTLSQLLHLYVTDLRVEGKAKATRKSYGSRLRALERWMRASMTYPGAAPTVVDYNRELLERYLLWLTEKGDRPRTVCSYLNAMRSFAAWLIEHGHLDHDPTERMKRPKLDAARRELVSDSEIKAMLDACPRLPSERRAAMAKAVLSIFCFCGVRRAELLNLRVEDVNLNDKSIVVRQGKGGKTRTLPLVQEARNALRLWIMARGECRHPYLFDIDGARRLADAGLRSLLQDVAAAAGMRGQKNLLPHSFRHNCATRLHRNGVELNALQALLGHANLNTTAIYLHSSQERLRELADKGAFSLEGEQEERTAPPLRVEQVGAPARQRHDVKAAWAERRRGEGAR